MAVAFMMLILELRRNGGETAVTARNQQGIIVLTSRRDPVQNLYLVPLDNAIPKLTAVTHFLAEFLR